LPKRRWIVLLHKKAGSDGIFVKIDLAKEEDVRLLEKNGGSD
jgi:hypothetical protein